MMKALLLCGTVAALCAPAFASSVLDVTETDNGDGSFTYWFEIDTLNELAFMELTIMGNLHQVQGNELYEQISDSPWAPNVVFTRDAALASAVDENYSANAHLDTVIDDEEWQGIVTVELTPDDGSQLVYVAMISGIEFHPLPGGFIPLAHVTTWGRNLWISGFIDYLDSDVVDFEWHIPEPSALMLGVLGTLGSVAIQRRRRHQSVAR